MINLDLSESDVNTILHGLYLLEDQRWFTKESADTTDNLINKLNKLLNSKNIKDSVVCDI